MILLEKRSFDIMFGWLAGWLLRLFSHSTIALQVHGNFFLQTTGKKEKKSGHDMC